MLLTRQARADERRALGRPALKLRPGHAERVEDHKMEAERFEIPESAASATHRALEGGRRVIAVGTTTVRALEHVAREKQGTVVSCRGETNLFILPGFEFQVTRALV